MDTVSPRSPIVDALHAHRTALAALGGFALAASQCFGNPGSDQKVRDYDMALKRAIETRETYNRLVAAAAVDRHVQQDRMNR